MSAPVGPPLGGAIGSQERALPADRRHSLPREGGRGNGGSSIRAGDSPPWYRQRWPWILMAGPAAVVVAGIVTAWIAASSHDGLVSDDYYKQGLAVNQKLARAEAAAALRLEARLRLTAGRVEIGLASAAGAPLPARLRITLAHPTRGGEDQMLLLEGERGAYAAVLAAPGPGRWLVAIEDEAGTWRLSGSVQLPDRPEAVFTAGGTR
ncbi:MAG: FixH family protein [Zoogloeaceae bacterium]|nr:FixH family protein [Zoogloeaceae bacterium]